MRHFPPFKLDFVNHCLWKVDAGGQSHPVGLTPRAFDVLRHLVENAGRLVTHEELLNAIWPDTDVQPEVLKGYVLAIRTALGDDAQKPRFIDTHRGRGYRFVARPGSDSGGTAMRPPRGSAGLFLGRGAELEALEDALRLARLGMPQLVFVTGAEGMGKSALVSFFLDRHASDEGLLRSWGACEEGCSDTRPCQAVLDAMARLSIGMDAESMRDALSAWEASLFGSGVGRAAGDAGTRTASAKLIEGASAMALCQLLDTLSASQCLVLVLEDVHRADRATVDFLSSIARRTSAAKLLILATYRPEEASGSVPLLVRVHQQLRVRRLCSDVSLGALRVEAVGEFVSSEDQVDFERFAKQAIEWSGGNPLLLLSLLDHLVDQGVAQRTPLGWSIAQGAFELLKEPPPTLAHHLESRLRCLSAEQQHVLEAGSVIGLEFDAVLAARVAGIDAMSCEDICEELARYGMFIRRAEREATGDEKVVRPYAFLASVYREVLLSRQGPLRLSERRRVAAGDVPRESTLPTIAGAKWSRVSASPPGLRRA
ncbi:AAA family ATPase [Variovorax sp. dw_308]|uniref:ATP-binding protein n=1 Tax=Variovorax sp. dw_308 TaxID=2721546 RepID=UPI001C460563|nr:AAA family ATPase [Variovorax sp. dw_308]